MPDVWARRVRRFLLTASGDKAQGIGSRVVVEPPAVGVLTIKPKKIVQTATITAPNYGLQDIMAAQMPMAPRAWTIRLVRR